MGNYLYYRIKRVFGLIGLILGHLKETSIFEYEEWAKNKNKKLWEAIVEWVLNDVFVYAFVGLILSLALNGWLNWFQCAVCYWLLFKVILSWNKGDK